MAEWQRVAVEAAELAYIEACKHTGSRGRIEAALRAALPLIWVTPAMRTATLSNDEVAIIKAALCECAREGEQGR
jgi:hypothetical protein